MPRLSGLGFHFQFHFHLHLHLHLPFYHDNIVKFFGLILWLNIIVKYPSVTEPCVVTLSLRNDCSH